MCRKPWKCKMWYRNRHTFLSSPDFYCRKIYRQPVQALLIKYIKFYIVCYIDIYKNASFTNFLN
jgi:hypothetical protein